MEQVLTLKPSLNEVVAILRSGVHPEEPPKAGWKIRQAVDSQGSSTPVTSVHKTHGASGSCLPMPTPG